MLDHYYTPRDLVASADLDPLPDVDVAKAQTPRAMPAVVDLTALDLLAFDCDSDSDSDSSSDDGYVSTLLRMKKQAELATPRRIAGARRVARAVSMPGPARATMDVDLAASPSAAAEKRVRPEGELFQSITAIPGLESTSFEELRLETYLQSLIATGTARPPPAGAPALVIPPAFHSQFCESRDEDDAYEEDMDMEDLTTPPSAPAHAFNFPSTAWSPTHPPPQPQHRAASFPFARWAP